MQTITIPLMRQVIDHIAVAKRRPCYFHGASGIGKSEVVAQACADHDGVLVDIRVSQYESVDLRGIPDIQGGTTVWNMPATMPFKGNAKFNEDGPPIFLFLDEVNQGDPSVLSVLYQLINDYRIGEHELMSNVVLLCAGNRGEDRGVMNRFPAPLSNRMTHYELIPDVKSWTPWALQNGASTVAVGFLNFKPEHFHNFDPAKSEHVFATPRSWMRAIGTFDDPTMSADLKSATIAGDVGEAINIELNAFAEIITKLKPIEEIIADPEGIDIDLRELDVQCALVTHVAGNMTKDNADPLMRFLQRFDDELVVMAWTLALGRDPDLTDTNAFLNVYSQKYRELFQS